MNGMSLPLEGEEREHMEALVEDLIHGEHEKGRGKLHIIDGDQWCCLGRAAAVAASRGCQVRREIVDIWDGYRQKTISVEMFGDSAEILCPEVREWYGFDTENPHVIMNDDHEAPAAYLNDSGYGGREYSLPEIGELFRRTYLGVSSSSGDTTSAS